MIGVGIITCNRPDFFKKCTASIKREWYDYLVVVNDGDDVNYHKDDQFHHYIKTTGGEGVGKAKNKALKHLMGKECEYIILVEDDMLFKGNIFEQYINAHKKTGIEHFMFGYHGPANKGWVSKGKPTPRKIIDYHNGLQIALNEHCVGAVCFYTKNCLEKVGLYDEQYTNAFEHVDHSYNLSKQGFTTPYWWWPDIANSLDYVEEQACSEESSAIRPRTDWQDNIGNSWDTFERKHNIGPTDIPDTDFNFVGDFLKIVKPKQAISFIVHFRKDTEHRMVNLDTVYNYYKTICPNSEFVFVEDDSEERIKHLVKPGDKYIFFENNKTYNKCIGYNMGLKESSNDIVCFLDIDCLVSIDSLIKGISTSNKGIISIAYNGTAIYIQHKLKEKIHNHQGTGLYKFIVDSVDKESVYTGYRDEYYAVGNTQAVGGCLIGKKETFERINGFNPNFIGWGYEDNEIISRAMQLEVPVSKIGNNTARWWLLHLPHEEGGVAITDKNQHEFYKSNEQEVRKVESMSKEELEKYIKSW
tara:strand:+ start:766 stop:2349 length:1584 start_codon:yes stop_codon:yes gene_type:complete